MRDVLSSVVVIVSAAGFFAKSYVDVVDVQAVITFLYVSLQLIILIIQW